jgi:hypothetical protein
VGCLEKKRKEKKRKKHKSKLKLLKNYLRSTISQERLNGLAMCTIEKDILDEIDLDTVIDDFASRNTHQHFLEGIEALHII